jgi:uncharacterized protein YjaG (DUF416 family)
MAIEELKQLLKLDHKKQIVFAYLTCERLYPNFLYFHNNYKFGNPHILREAIEFIYNSIITADTDNKKIHQLLKDIDTNTPYPGDFNTTFASAALNACGVIYETLNLLSNAKDSGKLIKDISTMATDTIDLYIQEHDNLDYNTDEDFEDKIFHNPLMQSELRIQKGIIVYLSKIHRVDATDIETLKELQFNNNKGNLMIG